MTKMKKEKKDIKVQIRITSTERQLLEKLIANNREISISKIFRDSLYENCKKMGIKLDLGVGSFKVG